MGVEEEEEDGGNEQGWSEPGSSASGEVTVSGGARMCSAGRYHVGAAGPITGSGFQRATARNIVVQKYYYYNSLPLQTVHVRKERVVRRVTSL